MFRFFKPKVITLGKLRTSRPSSKAVVCLAAVTGSCALLTFVLTVSLVTSPNSPVLEEPSNQEEGAVLEPQTSQLSSQAALEAKLSWDEEGEGVSPVTPDQVVILLDAMRELFPEGAYWNHVGIEDWDEFTVTDTPCDHSLDWDEYCNQYSGGIQELFPEYTPMEQCLGFAALVSDLIFGENAPVRVFTDYTLLRPGDHIRLELTEHSMIVLTVDEDGITVVECNSDYEHCRISWDRFLSWEDLEWYSYEMECITRYETIPSTED